MVGRTYSAVDWCFKSNLEKFWLNIFFLFCFTLTFISFLLVCVTHVSAHWKEFLQMLCMCCVCEGGGGGGKEGRKREEGRGGEGEVDRVGETEGEGKRETVSYSV